MTSHVTVKACDVLWQHKRSHVGFVESPKKDARVTGNASIDSPRKSLLDRACLAGP